MRKTLRLTKMLLVAAALLTGTSNVWAEVTPFSQSYESDGATCDWTSGNTGRYTTALAESDGNHYVQVSAVGNGNSGALITGSSTNGKAASGDNFTLVFDLKITGGNNQASWFEVNDANNINTNINGSATPANCVLLLQQTAVGATTWKINNNDGQTVNLSKTSWNTIKLTVNEGKTYLTVVCGDDEVFPRTVINTNSTTGGLGSMQFATKRYYSSMAIDNVVVREIEDGDLPTETYYTATFTDNTTSNDVTSGTTIYSDDEKTAVVANGMLLNATTYYYTATQAGYVDYEGSFTVGAADPTVSFTMTAQPIYAYTVNAVDGSSNILATLTSGSSYNTATVNYAYPQYVNVNGTLYNKTAIDKSYGTSFILTTDNQAENAVYTVTDYNNVVYYAEAENIDGMTASNSGQGDSRCSNRYGAYAENDVEFTTLTAGTYKISAAFCGGAGTTFTIYAGETEVWSAGTNGSRSEVSGELFTLTETTALTIKAAGSASVLLDNIFIQQLPPVTVDFYRDFATLVSPYALDFSSTATKAYTVHLDVDKEKEFGYAVLTQVPNDLVPANTPVVLYKGDLAQNEEHNYIENIPVIASAPDLTTDNILVAGTGAAVPSKEEGYTNLILQENGYNLGFYLANDQEVATDHAYLHIPDSQLFEEGGLSRIIMVFADNAEATGISATLTNNGIKNNEIFNLAGQRVSQPTKGLYIVGGRKVVVK